jgi:transcriptional regulator with XRE-family HTH domain|tara:strand:- start:13034 stop:13261 length:228 start_codon:yes stop_codon:yes gene_type:complete
MKKKYKPEQRELILANLIADRKSKGLSVYNLTIKNRNGVDQGNWSRYESGEKLPSLEQIFKMAKALGREVTIQID